MLKGLLIWCMIGALFGIPRARVVYKSAIKTSEGFRDKLDWRDYSYALFEALLELLKWTALGIFSGVSYLAWLLLGVLLNNKNEFKKANPFGAAFFSVVVFILGCIALEKTDQK